MHDVADKRIVVIHTKGPYQGLWQIVGTCDQLMANLHTEQLPDFLPDVDFLDRRSGVSLIKTRDRYVVYRETMDWKTAANFDPSQR